MDANGVTIITGGSRGIGAATAVLLASRGRSVFITYRERKDEAAAVVEQCGRYGVQAKAVQLDVADETQIIEVFNQARETHKTITGLVNNAGILHTQCRLTEMSAERIRKSFEVNVVGAMICAREAARHMSTASGGNGGCIVNVSSRAANLGSPNEYIDYAATKGALNTMTIGLAKEVATEGIRVNGVKAGLIYTDIHVSGGMPDRVNRLAHGVPMNRGGTATEVAEAIAFLLSEQSSYVTGAFVDVSGGR